MAVTRVQGASASGTTSVSFPSNVTAGNFLRLTFRDGNVGDTPSVTDSLSQTWTQALEQDISVDGDSVFEFYFQNTKGGACTVTITGLSGSCILAVSEYSGIATSGTVVRATNSSDGTDVTSQPSGNVTADAGDLVVGSSGTDNNAGGTWTAGGTSAGGSWATDENPNQALYTQYVVATSTGTFESQPVYSTDLEIASLVVVYKAASGSTKSIAPDTGVTETMTVVGKLNKLAAILGSATEPMSVSGRVNKLAAITGSATEPMTVSGAVHKLAAISTSSITEPMVVVGSAGRDVAVVPASVAMQMLVSGAITGGSTLVVVSGDLNPILWMVIT